LSAALFLKTHFIENAFKYVPFFQTKRKFAYRFSVEDKNYQNEEKTVASTLANSNRFSCQL